MKALTVRQPHAQLIALGVKTIETRTKPTKYRGPLLIHAGSKPPKTSGLGLPVMCERNDPSAGGEYWFSPGELRRHDLPNQIELPLGAIVASCKLEDCVPIVGANHQTFLKFVCPNIYGQMTYYEFGKGADHPATIERDITDQLPYGDYSTDEQRELAGESPRFAWLLEDIKPTTERCPACWGIGRVEGPLHLDAADIWDCPKCDGKGNCDPISAKGKLGFWNWEP